MKQRAHVGPNLSAAVGPFYSAEYTKPYNLSYMVAALTQDTQGNVTGTVRETDKTCGGTVAGHVSGTAISMVWTWPLSCSGDVLTLSGTLGSSTTMSGTLTSPDHGPGTFRGKKQ